MGHVRQSFLIVVAFVVPVLVSGAATTPIYFPDDPIQRMPAPHPVVKPFVHKGDHLYDFIVEIDHNSSPRIAGRGSAVFLHLARDNFGPTAGCVSMRKSAMLHLLRRMGPETRIVIE